MKIKCNKNNLGLYIYIYTMTLPVDDLLFSQKPQNNFPFKIYKFPNSVLPFVYFYSTHPWVYLIHRHTGRLILFILQTHCWTSLSSEFVRLLCVTQSCGDCWSSVVRKHDIHASLKEGVEGWKLLTATAQRILLSDTTLWRSLIHVNYMATMNKHTLTNTHSAGQRYNDTRGYHSIRCEHG